MLVIGLLVARLHDLMATVCMYNSIFAVSTYESLEWRVTGLCEGNSPGTGEFPAQMASSAENASIWWRYHDASRVNHQSGRGGKATTKWYVDIVNIIFWVGSSGTYLGYTSRCFVIGMMVIHEISSIFYRVFSKLFMTFSGNKSSVNITRHTSDMFFCDRNLVTSRVFAAKCPYILSLRDVNI